jgi:glycosyltransferase involved in cell wall biosynthesis
MNTISVVIITLNEERNILRCLQSVKDIADEIIVVDSFSTDKTEDICINQNVKFIKTEWKGYSETKNFANNMAINDYIFSIDADEAVSDILKESIVIMKNNSNPANVYSLNRLTNYCGKWIKHSGWYPDSKFRIWKNGIAKWEGELHENLVFNSNFKTEILKGDLLHFSYYSITDHIKQFNKFTDIGALQAFQNHKKANLWIALYKSNWKFIRDYFFKFGFLDGYYGYVICKLSSKATFLKYLKIIELQHNNK